MVFEYIKNFIDEAKKLHQIKEEKMSNYLNSIDDEIVKKSSFLALKKGWYNFETHNLIEDNFWNLIFKAILFFPYLFVLVFSMPLIFTLLNLTIYISTEYNNINLNELSNYASSIWAFCIFPIPFVILFYNWFQSKIFDFQNWYYYDLRYKNNIFSLINDEKYRNKIIDLKQIHALQIISERVYNKNSSYTSYELNMILQDSSRVNIVDYSNLETIKSNAELLWNRLKIKIWELEI